MSYHYPSIRHSVKPSDIFSMMTSKFEAVYSNNTAANPMSGFETVVIANCILNAPVMLLSIIGNTLLLVAILRTPSIRSPSVIFLCNLAVSDLLVGLVVEPAYIAEQIVRTVTVPQKAVKTMGFAGCSVSLWTITAITVDPNYSNNTEANPKSGIQTAVIANCILNAPLMLLSIIGNALVLVAILRTPSTRSPSVIFLCNLAVTDFLVGSVVQPTYIAEQIARTVPTLSEAVGAMGFAMCGVSLWTITAITVDLMIT
ncbi:hypothetical protein pdam_00018825, partial [Pocillopora damicornis]